MNAGDKFEISFDQDAAEDDVGEAPGHFSFVGDILERQPTTALPPVEPKLRSKTGFPAHTKKPLTSRFKQKRQDETSGGLPHVLADRGADHVALTEKQQIDQENRERLASMSPQEIEEARQEILSSLDASLLQRLLRRADISSGSNEATSLEQHDLKPEENQPSSPNRNHHKPKKVTFEEEVQHDDAVEALPAAGSTPLDSIHFPRAPQPPELDPNSETFLEDLHSKYFPSLPAEPEKLKWMRASDQKNSYDPTQSAVNPCDIRFDFKGALIAPSKAARIPVSAGLHHHADAPDAAGYTIAELAHLSRSTYAPQRCIAFQTLGRILFKLGKGEFGNAGEPGADTVGAEDTMGELARGLWREVETEHVIEQLVAESEGNGIDGGRHISAKAYATEAVWLWQKGGGRRWKAT